MRRHRLARAIVHRLLRLARGGVLELRERDRPPVRFGALDRGRAAAARCSRSTPRPSTARLLRGSIGLAEAHMDGLWSSPDLVALVRLGARNGEALDRPRRWLRPLIGPARALGPRAQHDPSQPPPDRRPLRPRQRPLRALPRRADDVLVGDLPAPRARRSRRRRCTSSSWSAASSTCGPGDHLLEIGTGWGGLAVHAAAQLRLPRDDDHDLARAARPRRRGACAPPAWRIA